MIDFYFVDQMTGSENSWWPSLVGALLGALVSGIFAVIISRGDYRRRQREKSESQRALATTYVRLVEELIERISGLPREYSTLAEKYKGKPFDYNGYFTQSTRRMERLLQYDQIELSIAFGKSTGLTDPSSQISTIFSHIDFLMDYANRMNSIIPDILKQWSDVAKVFKSGIENLKTDTSSLTLSLRAMGLLDGHRAQLLVDLNNVLVEYLNEPPAGSDQDLTYHYEKFPLRIINLYNRELFESVPEVRDLAQQAKRLQWLYKDMESLIINELCVVLTRQLKEYGERISGLEVDVAILSQSLPIR